MNIDEFLVNKSAWCEIDQKIIIKINYNKNVDYLYTTYLYDWSIYNESKLSLIGIYDKKHNELYGNSYYLDNNEYINMKSTKYKGSIEQITNNLYEKLDIILEDYIINNESELMNLAQAKFDKYISDQRNYEEIKSKAIDKYIHDEEFKKSRFSKSFGKYEINETKLKLECLDDIDKVSKDIFDKYINSNEQVYLGYRVDNEIIEGTNKEDIGFNLLVLKLKNNLLQELKNNPIYEYKKKHDILKSIKDLDAQMVTITLKHNDNLITFKYPRSKIYSMCYSKYKIPDLKAREQMEEWYKDRTISEDDLFMSEIVKIEYAKKVLYEDQSMLNKQNIEQEMNDITDEMY